MTKYPRMTVPEGATVKARPAAAVVVLRDAPGGCETLLLRRSVRLAFHGGAWVFPGGRIDVEDLRAAGDGGDPMGAARQAAVRETREESGLELVGERLRAFSRWITPEGLPKRFDAWYFAAPADAGEVRVDGEEILEHLWIRPGEAIAAHRRGEMELPPPTWVTLARFAGLATVPAALAAVARWPVDEFRPRLHLIPDGACALYEGDIAYESGDIDAGGARHRLWMRDAGWYYERSGLESVRERGRT